MIIRFNCTITMEVERADIDVSNKSIDYQGSCSTLFVGFLALLQVIAPQGIHLIWWEIVPLDSDSLSREAQVPLV
jgi:hypothetical protein